MARGNVGQPGHQFLAGRPTEAGRRTHLQAFADVVEFLDLGDRIVTHLHALVGLADGEAKAFELVKGSANGVPSRPGAGDDLVFDQPLARAILPRDDATLQVAIDRIPGFSLFCQRLGRSHPVQNPHCLHRRD
ncbi:hypothetical protein D9M68_887630 [compost metagenome]